jgi:radical SAM superfamily enzyme YgiQ (UPF0313 family)
MEIFLINPDLSDGAATCMNLGLGYVASSLIENGYKVNIIDLSFCKRDYQNYILNNFRHIKDNRCFLVGFSVVSDAFFESIAFARSIKVNYPNAIILFGGTHPTLFPEETLLYSQVDVVCIGEGEKTLVYYLNRLQKGEDNDIDGIWYKRDGVIVRNKLRRFEDDLNTIPFPAKDYFKMNYFLKFGPYFPGTIPYLASRGCPYRCTFCSNKVLSSVSPGRYYRLRNPENIITEIKKDLEKFRELGFKNVGFVDATFGMDWEQFSYFCYLFKKEGLNKKLTWSCETRADVISDVWARMATETGCILVNLGVESGNAYIRNEIYNKHLLQEDIFNAVNNFKRHGIMTSLNIIYGCPQDTKETLMDSLHLIKKTRPTGVMFFPFAPYPETEIAKNTVYKDKSPHKTFLKYIANKPSQLTFLEFIENSDSIYRIPTEIKKIVSRFRKKMFLKILLYCVINKNIRFFLDAFREMLSLSAIFSLKVILRGRFLTRRTYFKYLYENLIIGVID